MIIHWWELATIVVGSGLVCTFLVFFLVSRYVKAREAILRDFVNDYFIPPDNDSPSKFGLTIDAVGQSVGAHLASNMKASIMGMASGEARQEKAAMREVAQTAISQANPALGAIVSSTPIGKMLGKNPEVLGGIAQWLMTKQGGSNPRSNHSRKSDLAAKLSKYN